MSHNHDFKQDGSLKHACGCFKTIWYKCKCGEESLTSLPCTCKKPKEPPRPSGKGRRK